MTRGEKEWNSEVGCKRKHQQEPLQRSQKGSVAMRLERKGNMLIPWTKQGTQRVACADGSAGLMLGKRGDGEFRVITGKGCLKPQGRMRSSWMGACCCCLVSLGQEKEVGVSRTPTLWGREGRGGEEPAEPCLEEQGGRSECHGPDLGTSGPGLSRHLHPPLTGLGTPSS